MADTPENQLALERCRARFRAIAPDASPDVRLHCYTINSLGWWHMGVSVFDVEWSLDGYQNMLAEQLHQRKDTFKGVQSSLLKPRHEAMRWFMGGKPLYKESLLGRTTRSPLEVRALLEHLIMNEFHAGWASTPKSYKMATHNCQDFAQAFVVLLLERGFSAALIPPEFTQLRDCVRYVFNPAAWLGACCPPPTSVRNDTGRALYLRVCGPTLTDWRAATRVVHEVILRDGDAWTEACAPRVLRLYLEPPAAGDGRDGPIYETPCLGQHVRLSDALGERPQRGGDGVARGTTALVRLEHDNLLTIPQPVLLW